MTHGLDTSFLVATEVACHADHIGRGAGREDRGGECLWFPGSGGRGRHHRVGEGYGLKINLREQAKGALPTEVAGVPVQVEVVGAIRKQ